MEEEKHKVCFKCGINKPLSEFYKHPQMADGHLGKCKDCAKKDTLENRQLRGEFYKAYDRVRSYSENRKEQRREYQSRAAVKERQKLRRKEWEGRNKEKKAANTAVGNAVRDGRLFKQPCFICGAIDDIKAHHYNYDTPLEVTWLCTKHHGEVHREYDEREDKEILENTVRGNKWD